MKQEIDQEVVETQLENLRKRLLDFSTRNDLLNHTHNQRSTKYIRVVDELPNELYSKLVEGKMEFKALPDVDSEPPDEKTPDFLSKLELEKLTNQDYQTKVSELGNKLSDEQEIQALDRELRDVVRSILRLPPFKRGKNVNLAEHAKLHGFNPNYELPLPDDFLSPEHSDKFIQTLFVPDGLDRRLRSLYSKYQQFLSDTGINVLRAGFGFLEWYEDKNSDRALHAPLLMLPLTMERVASRSGARFYVSSGGMQAELNQTLAEKLKSMNVELPEFEENDTPEIYFEKIVPLIEKKSKWNLRRFVTIGIFPFQKISMWKDLEANSWPLNSLLENSILATLLGGLESGSSYGSALDEYEIDELSIRGEAPPIYMSADSSQHSAIMDVLEGKNLVIQGPPGTGKSQTIANIIAAAMHQNKSILFVAEKQAALNVVASRLRAIGLGPCLLDLHKRNDKTSMHCGIQENIEARHENKQPDTKNGKGVLKYHLEKFRKHEELLHRETGYTSLSGYELLWKYINLKSQLNSLYEVGEFNFDGSKALSEEQLSKNLKHIEARFDDELLLEVKSKAESLSGIVEVANPIAIQEIQRSAKRLLDSSKKIANFFISNQEGLKHLFLEDDVAPTLENLYQIKYLVTNLSPCNPVNAEHLERCLEQSSDRIPDDLKKISKSLFAINEYRSKIPSSLDFENIKEDYSIRELKELLQQLSKKRIFSKLSSELKRATEQASLIGIEFANEPRGKANLKLLIELIEETKSIERETEKYNFLPFIDGVETNQKALNEFVDYLFHIHKMKVEINEDGSNKIIDQRLFSSSDSLKFLASINNTIFEEEFLESVQELIEEHLEATNSEIEPSEASMDEFFEICSLISKSTPAELMEIAKINSAKEGSDWQNLNEFLSSERVAKFKVNEAKTLYQYLEVEAQIKLFISDDYKVLSELNGKELQELRRKFATNDKILMREEAQDVLFKTLKKNIPNGNSKGLKSTFTEFSLIRNEMSKKARFIPIRNLVKRATGALKAMKPVWMMSPLAISQFLERKPNQFDILIIDEASQMRPEDALPAILRAKQLVVVGDNKQLPPTSFFDTSIEATDIDEEEDVQQESILDLAADRLADTRTLRWHYRSRHPDLIRFSNKRFYDNKLLVFPTPNPKADEMGVKYVQANGIYQSSLNQIEAQRVVEEAITQMANFPDKSLAIVAMNVKQKEYIRELFEQELSRDDVVSDYFETWKENDLEPFIIRNLESIQGDERDVVIVSTVYGPNEQGSVRQDFGPVNRYYGSRRLNVLFSRAKEKLILVTSLNSGDIKLDGSQNQSGKAALQEYISFASTGILEVGEDLEREPDSDFEIAVIQQLKNHGYDAVPQVGVDGFRIDIGVRHEDFPHGFIAGIECDGATYHSSKSARDRDKIRQDILEGLGWKIYRIWSTDWFQDSEKETVKMIEQLEFYKEAALSHIKKSQKKKADKSNPETKDKVVPLNVAESTTQKSEQVSEAPIPKAREPFGRRRELEYNGNIIVFYEDNAEYFEVWQDDQLIGEIEKQGVVTQRAVLYGGSIQGLQKPKYQCELLVPVSITKSFDDIFVSLKWIYDSYKERVS